MKYFLLLSIAAAAIMGDPWPRHYVSYRALINVPDSTMPKKYRSVLDTTRIAIEIDSVNKLITIGKQVFRADQVLHLDTLGICQMEFWYHRGQLGWQEIVVEHTTKAGWGWRDRLSYMPGFGKLASTYYIKPMTGTWRTLSLTGKTDDTDKDCECDLLGHWSLDGSYQDAVSDWQ
jgi:hypothetical protein